MVPAGWSRSVRPYRVPGMSDVPHSPGWWQAGDGRWYPPPPGLSDETAARPPTPPPDRPPSPFDPGAKRPLLPLPPEPDRQRARRGPLVGVIAVLLVIALIVGLTIAISDRESKNASANDPAYQLVIEQVLDSELTNLIFLETFWDSYGVFTDEWRTATEAERPAIAERWLEDLSAQAAQFTDDLAYIEDDYTAQKYKDGSVPDSVRDLAVAHYQSWADWAAAVEGLARDWLRDPSSKLSLYGYITEVQPDLDTRIESTFTKLCETLTTTQPTDGSYLQTIADVCETS